MSASPMYQIQKLFETTGNLVVLNKRNNESMDKWFLKNVQR